MTRTLSQIVLLGCDILWRRFRLAVLPLLILPLLGLAYVMLGPRPYVASSLLLLQENVRLGPLQTETPPISLQDRIGGLQALLTSDRVLLGVMSDILGPKAQLEPKEAEVWMSRFARNLELELVGNDFIRVQLKGGSPNGLGKMLEFVVFRFMEALLPEQGAISAVQVLMDRRKMELEAAERALARFEAQVGARLPEVYSNEMTQLEHEKLKYRQTSQALVEAREALLRLRRQTAGAGTTPKVQAVGKEGRNGAAQDTTASEGADGLDPIEHGRQLQQIEASYHSLETETGRLKDAVSARLSRLQDLSQAAQQARALEDVVSKARDAYDTYVKRYNNSWAIAGGPRILQAPERIKVVDMPRDPVFSTMTARKIMLVACLAGLFLALGLVVLAELLDTTVRYTEQFESLSGLPVLARLPGPSPLAQDTG